MKQESPAFRRGELSIPRDISCGPGGAVAPVSGQGRHGDLSGRVATCDPCQRRYDLGRWPKAETGFVREEKAVHYVSAKRAALPPSRSSTWRAPRMPHPEAPHRLPRPPPLDILGHMFYALP